MSDCKNELEFLVVVLNDYVGKLDQGARIATAEKVQNCLTTITQSLQPQAAVESAPTEPAQLLTEKK